MQSRVHHLKFVIVADERQQRMALAETLQALELRAMACVNSQELLTGGLDNTKVMSDCVWLVDVADYGRLEEEIALFEPKLVLVGFNPAPDYGNANYEKWQRALTRKLSQALQSPALLKKKPPIVHKPWRYVVFLGASMGGLKAIKAFLDELSPKLPIAVLIAHHYDADTIGNLPKILTRQNDWRCQVVSTTQSLQSGLCLIAPVDRQVVCDSTGRVILTKHGWQGDYRPNIGMMLKNVSEVYGLQLIGIVFSGMGNDGSQFAKELVKNHSMLWAQDPKSSDSPSQPQAFIDTGVCQFVGTPQMLAQKLNSMIAPYLIMSAWQDDFDENQHESNQP